MKNGICLLLFTALASTIFCQSPVNNVKPQKVPKYEMPGIPPGALQMVLEMNFAEDEWQKAEDAIPLGSDILSIDLVYTDFPKGRDFKPLNQKRWKELLSLVPDLRFDPEFDFRLISQTDCNSKEEAKELFHGFVIHYLPGDGFTERHEGAKNALRQLVDLYAGKVDTDSMEMVVIDSTVMKVMDRNDWSDMLITADLTGSMAPYTAQLLIWLNLNLTDGKIKHFMFFNDGDTAPDHTKVVGETGGLYEVGTMDYERVLSKAAETMARGNGSDLQENDIEALLAGIKSCPDCKDIILVADNNSPVRDIELMKDLGVPIRVILCGFSPFNPWGGGANPQYLNLAKETGGSVHTMEDDLLRLAELNEGESVEIFGRQYVIKNGRFVEVSRM